jgi:selenocysteine lyase/cysteine desulfurase
MTSDFSRESDSEKVARLRELIPATSAGIYLDTATRGPLVAESAEAMREADDWELRVGRVSEGRDEDVVQRHDEARAVLAALLGADPDAITLAPSLETAAWFVERHLRVPAERIQRHVDPSTGERAAPARTPGVPAVLDASLSAGAVPFRADELDVDAVILACDRWLMGPESIAAVWLREPIGRGMAVARTALLGLARTVGWLEMYVGLEWVYRRGETLTHRLFDALDAAEGVTMITPRDALATTICFRVDTWSMDEALDELRRRAFALIGKSGDGSAVRASVAWFNTEEELDRFSAAVAEIARHTPQTLPRRPLLVIQ